MQVVAKGFCQAFLSQYSHQRYNRPWRGAVFRNLYSFLAVGINRMVYFLANHEVDLEFHLATRCKSNNCSQNEICAKSVGIAFFIVKSPKSSNVFLLRETGNISLCKEIRFIKYELDVIFIAYELDIFRRNHWVFVCDST